MSTTIRLSTENRDRVNRLKRETGESSDAVLGRALDAYERTLFWEQMRHAHAAASPEQRAAAQAESALWDATLLDGIS